MSLSQIARTIGESVTLKLNATAERMRAQGEAVIHLGGGEPKSRAPIEALVAAAGLLNTGEIRYAPADGTPAMKQAIIKYTDEFYGRPATPKNVMASGGAKQAIMVAMQAVLNPHDEVIYPVPYWVSYPDMCRLCGAVPVPVRAGDGSFYVRIQDIEKAATKATKCILINSPNNPSGAMYSEQFIADIVAFCEKRDIYLIMDDIYHRLVFDGRQPISSWKFVKDKSEKSKLIIVNGVSKQYAMTGFRIGWAVANQELILAMANIQSHQTSGPSALLQAAAVAAINGSQACVESLRVTLENNRDVLVSRLSSLDGVKVSKPDGTFYCFADFSAYDKDSTKLANMLLEKVQVVTVPGVEFGMEGYLRLSYCGEMKDMTEGIERIKWALDPSAPKELHVGNRKLVRDWA